MADTVARGFGECVDSCRVETAPSLATWEYGLGPLEL